MGIYGFMKGLQNQVTSQFECKQGAYLTDPNGYKGYGEGACIKISIAPNSNVQGIDGSDIHECVGWRIKPTEEKSNWPHTIISIHAEHELEIRLSLSHVLQGMRFSRASERIQGTGNARRLKNSKRAKVLPTWNGETLVGLKYLEGEKFDYEQELIVGDVSVENNKKRKIVVVKEIINENTRRVFQLLPDYFYPDLEMIARNSRVHQLDQ